jgi:hypothetical protein
MNIGSNPKPPEPRGRKPIVPTTVPRKHFGLPAGLQNATADRKLAFLFLTPSISFSTPFTPSRL